MKTLIAKGVGRIYQQTFVDTYSRVAFAKLYTSKTPITAADALNDRVLPFFESYGMGVLRILTDRGTEYCGQVDQHDFQLFLGLNDIDHTKTKAKSPQTNGICERTNLCGSTQGRFHAWVHGEHSLSRVYASVNQVDHKPMKTGKFAWIYGGLVFFTVLVLNGCASLHRGEIEKSASLITGNFVYVKQNQEGRAAVDYVFGFGGYKTESLVHDAKKDLLKNAQLGPNQAFANMTVTYKTTFSYLVWVKHECLITADVVEFKGIR
jgi:transposase InsO family protein